jgi:hypothetical protein
MLLFFLGRRAEIILPSAGVFKKGPVANFFIKELAKIQTDCFCFITDAQVHSWDVFENVAKDQRDCKGANCFLT